MVDGAIRMARASFKIDMMNLGYHIRRLVQPERGGGGASLRTCAWVEFCALCKPAPPQRAGYQKGPRSSSSSLQNSAERPPRRKAELFEVPK